MDRWSLVSHIADKAHLLFKSSFAVVYGGKIVRFENKMCMVWYTVVCALWREKALFVI